MRRALLRRSGGAAAGLVAGGYLGGTGSLLLHTSPDGITWTSRTTPAELAQIYDIAYAPALHRHVAVGQDPNTGNLWAWCSDDAATWTKVAMSALLVRATSIAWSPALSIFCAGATSSWVGTSPDGITWTKQGNFAGNASATMDDVVWCPSLGLFVGVSSSSDTIATSPDGITFTTRSTAMSQPLCVAWSPLRSIAVAGAAFGFLRSSTNGTTWTSRTYPFSQAILVAYWSAIAGRFITVTDAGNVATSTDGLTWAAAPSGGANPANTIADVPALATIFMGGGSGQLLSSTDGLNWLAVADNLSASTAWRALIAAAP